MKVYHGKKWKKVLEVNMGFKVTVLKLAMQEIDSAFEYYEGKKVGLGEEFLIYLKGYINVIKTFPEFSRIQQHGFRELHLKKFPFTIIYEVTLSGVIIHSIFNTNSNPSKKVY